MNGGDTQMERASEHITGSTHLEVEMRRGSYELGRDLCKDLSLQLNPSLQLKHLSLSRLNSIYAARICLSLLCTCAALHGLCMALHLMSSIFPLSAASPHHASGTVNIQLYIQVWGTAANRRESDVQSYSRVSSSPALCVSACSCC